MRGTFSFVAVALSVVSVAQTPSRIALTPSGNPSTQLSVSWRTDAAAPESRLEWVRATSNPNSLKSPTTRAATTKPFTTPEGDAVQYHRVELTGLVPDTRYTYRVGNGRSWSEWFEFRTAAAESKPFRFIYLGDAQNDIRSVWSRSIRAAVQAAPDARLILHAGDLVDMPQRDSDWAAWFSGGGWIHASIPVVAAIGNHEYFRAGETRRLSTFWQPQFNYPNNGVPGLEESNYTFDHMGVRFIVLDAMQKLEEQATWLDRVLSTRRQHWTVVCFHHPIYSTAVNRDNPRHRALWQPILEKHQVDLVLNGHDHSYGRRVGPNGLTNYIVSVAGPKMYELNTQNTQHMVRSAANLMTYQVISVEPTRIRYESRTLQGQLFDAFEIQKPVGQQKGRVVETRP